MERCAFTVGKGALLPQDAEARAVLAKLAIGETVAVEVYRERSLKFSNAVQLIFDRIAQAKGRSIRNIRGWIAAATGRADLVKIGKRTVLVAHSTSPREMGNVEFEAFWDDARDVILDEIIPTLSPEDAANIGSMVRQVTSESWPASAPSAPTAPRRADGADAEDQP
jgi:hypothetical protein